MDGNQLLVTIYRSLGELDIKATPTNTKLISAIYTEVERYIAEVENAQTLETESGETDGGKD